MEDKKIIKLRDKNGLHMSWACPYCGSRQISSKQRNIRKISTVNEDSFYPGDKEIYYETMECTCTNCSKEFVFDYGESTYVIYDKPISINNVRSILCLSRYESEMHQNFGIYSTKNPENDEEIIYFIMYEDDGFPIFITASQMEKMIRDCEELRSFSYCTTMTRYR